jgi:hypothetical protein
MLCLMLNIDSLTCSLVSIPFSVSQIDIQTRNNVLIERSKVNRHKIHTTPQPQIEEAQ